MSRGEVRVDVSGVPSWPTDVCANCASDVGLELRATRLVFTQAVVLPGMMMGAETKLEQALPFCAACASTARRLRPGFSELFVVWGGLALLGLLFGTVPFLMWMGPMPDDSGLGTLALLIGPALATLVCAAWYGTRRTRAPQTSWYQPVRLIRSGKNGLRLGFTNAAYATRFRSENPDATLY